MFLFMIPLLLIYFFGGLFVCGFGARWANRRFGSRWAGLGGFLLMFIFIFGDEIYGYTHWQSLCRTQGGLHVYKQVPVDGFMEAGNIHEGIAEEYLRKGYLYVESGYYRDAKDKLGQLYRYSIGSDGVVTRSEIIIPESRYVLSGSKDVPYFPYVWGYEYYIKDMASDEQISAKRILYYKGATVIRALRAMTGAEQSAAQYCGASSGDQLVETLPPTSQKTTD